MRRLVIAEKGKVMEMIAAALGNMSLKGGTVPFWEGADLMVAAAQGHLVELEPPKQRTLPIFPVFTLCARPGMTPRISRIGQLAATADVLVNACDAGREGELIFRRIVEFLGLQDKPSERLWLQSLTPDAIRRRRTGWWA